MARKPTTATATAPDRKQAPPATQPTTPGLAELLEKVATLLQNDEAAQALTLVAKSKSDSPWVTNARGVCELRLGQYETAVSLFRGLVLTSGIFLRPDAPAVFKTNYATALFAAENLAGGLNAMEDLRAETHPAALRLREAVQRWEQSLSWWQRFNRMLGGQPHRPVELSPPLGDLT